MAPKPVPFPEFYMSSVGLKSTGKIPQIPKYRLHGLVEQLGTCVRSPREAQSVHLFLLLAACPSPIPGTEGRGKGLLLPPSQVRPAAGRSAGGCVLGCGSSRLRDSWGGQDLGQVSAVALGEQGSSPAWLYSSLREIRISL